MSPAEIEAWRQRKAEIIARYGSADAATAPCPRERLLLAAVAPWRTTSEEWTLSVDGWRGDASAYHAMSARALQAIKAAILLPTTFGEAKAEAEYWVARNEELRDVLSDDGISNDDVALDLVAEVRAAIVRDLALHELAVTSIGELHARCRMHQDAGVDDPRFVEALFWDIAAMADVATAYPSATGTHAMTQIRAALSADPSRSDRDIARALHCSPTSVGKARAAMDLRSSTRAVSRGGRKFEMRIAAAPTADAG